MANKIPFFSDTCISLGTLSTVKISVKRLASSHLFSHRLVIILIRFTQLADSGNLMFKTDVPLGFSSLAAFFSTVEENKQLTNVIYE